MVSSVPPRDTELIVSAQRLLFSRRYRAALLDYLLGNGETGLSNAYDLGRSAIDEDFGLLQILRAHQRAVNAVLESTHTVPESLKRLRAAEDFLMETLSPFEMTYRGYVALIEGDPARTNERPERKKIRRRA
jgi:phosphoserine phosphatase RsbU-like protein